jgi:hypothetical protein
MDEDTATQAQPRGRTFNARVAGDTAEEIEFAALDEARKFFGPDVQLEVVKDYSVIAMVGGHPLDKDGKKYLAGGGVQVRTIEP